MGPSGRGGNELVGGRGGGGAHHQLCVRVNKEWKSWEIRTEPQISGSLPGLAAHIQDIIWMKYGRHGYTQTFR